MPQLEQEISLREREQEEARAVVGALARSPLMARLLSHICSRYFAGEAHKLNELDIAFSVFNRTAGFDPTRDSIARVEIHRLRKKLRLFYETQGQNHAIQIEILPGSYMPVFRYRDGVKLAEPLILSSEATQQVTGPEPEPREASAPESIELAPVPHTPSPRGSSATWLGVSVGAIVALAVVLFLTTRLGSHKHSFHPGTIFKAQTFPAPTSATGDAAVRFLCGYTGPPHIGALGEVWGPDQFFRGGRPWPTRPGYYRRTTDPFLFKNARTGEFSYDIPVKPGVYELHLYFIETEYGEDLGGGENSRTFSIHLNGQVLFVTFDPLSDAAGPRTADERVIRDVSPAHDGYVHLSFESQRGEPLLNAIALLPGIAGQQRPIRLVTALNSYTDHLGHIWAPDNYYLGGQLYTDKPPVTGTADPQLFASERAGNFTYAIPVDTRGIYTANLYLAESYFGTSQTTSAGRRVFNVTCDGVLLMDHFDPLRESGSAHAIIKTFRHLKPNAQGKLLLGFEPIENYASVFAIEVLDEGAR
jgi:hypothetical protein